MMDVMNLNEREKLIEIIVNHPELADQIRAALDRAMQKPQ